MDVAHVVILTMENRSFDEYFGTFPGANGFYNNPQSTFDSAWVPSPGGWTDPPVLPYRLSTFTSQQSQIPQCNHGPGPQHAFFANGAMNGWSLQHPGGGTDTGNPLSCMGYYAADDIPYHWWLAQNFALCDNYFCSVMGPTWPNRDYLLTGKIQNQAQYTNNPGMYTSPPSWTTYAQTLTDNTKTWRVYDAAYAATPAGYPTNTTDLNAFNTFTSSWPGLTNSSTYVQDDAIFSQFATDAKNGNLQTVSWLFPWYGFCEHPSNTPADGAYLICHVVEAVLTGLDWGSTVLIINYDENDGHFDHVPPPQPPSQSEYPDEFVPGPSPGTYQGISISIGAGFRVPCFIISPWTLGRGICSDQYDHTSVLQFLEDVTTVPCPNIGAWRRATFGSLTSASPSGFSGPGAPLSAVPPRPDAATLRLNAMNRYNTAPGFAGGASWTSTAAGQLVPDPPVWPPVAQTCQVIVTMPSFGQGQVNGQPGASFPGALMVVVNGFEPAELTTPNAGYTAEQYSGLQTIAAQSPVNPACSTRVPNISITDGEGNPVAIEAACQYVDFDPGSSDNQTQSGVPRPFTFYYSLTFADPDATFGGLSAGQVEVLSVLATFQVDITVTSGAELELVATDDPQFYHNFDNDTFYLSGELQVFSAQGGDYWFGEQLIGADGIPANVGPADALNFITAVMENLNQYQGSIPAGQVPGGSSQILSFDQLNVNEDSISLPLYPLTAATPPLPIFNFALARVHMQAASSDPAMVRVFFRSFRASSTATGFETANAYRYLQVAPGYRIPLLGKGENQATGEYATIPFFATPRINSAQPWKAMTEQPIDGPNLQLMQTSGSDGTIEAYFGCWLDINQTTPLFPIEQPADPALIDGPFFSQPPVEPLPGIMPLPIQGAFFNDLHQCLIAEISFYTPVTPPNPITDDTFFPPPGDTPEYSAWLAQRNLSLAPAPNPGAISSRRVLGTFDIRPTTPGLPSGVEPDELLFDWSGLPPGSTATIYLPEASADAVVAQATSMYGWQPFSVVDAHTLRCQAAGDAYLPIPEGLVNFAGLLDIELPGTVHDGDQFVVVVYQITNAGGDETLNTTAVSEPAARTARTWRKVSGTFQLSIPVSTKEQILPAAERDLSVMRWILEVTPTTSRWYPVLVRYVEALGDRVGGLGGDPATVPPSVTGSWPGMSTGTAVSHGPPTPPGRRHDECEFTGKVETLTFDRFGDFEAFTLELEDGEHYRFDTAEHNMAQLVERAWRERIRVTVVTWHHERRRPVRVLLHAPG